MEILAAISGQRRIDRLIGALRDSDPRVRQAAAWALGRLGDPEAVPALVALLAGPNEEDRRLAARALGVLGDPGAVPALAAALFDRDPYGFTSWLNDVRARYGLPPVGHDPNLSAWAAVNNDQQVARGLGHWVMTGTRRQNAATGYGFPGSAWMSSPGHRSARLDPTIRWIGIASSGFYWTMNAY